MIDLATLTKGEEGVVPMTKSEADYYAAVTPDAILALVTRVRGLEAACLAAKKYLEPDLVEPGRTVFWKLVEVLTPSSA